MESRIKIDIELFGEFRRYGSKPISLILPKGCGIKEVRQHLADELIKQSPAFAKSNLLHDSVLADGQEILRQDTIFQSNVSLVILPPVSGG